MTRETYEALLKAVMDMHRCVDKAIVEIEAIKAESQAHPMKLAA